MQVVDLPDVDEATLRALLDYMYCEDDAPLGDPNLLCHVLKVAHRFDVTDLVALCTSRVEVSGEAQCEGSVNG